jgi:hypothetical protein
MADDQKRIEREARAARLKLAHGWAGDALKGPKLLSQATGIKIDTVKAHEQGRNGFEIPDARRYAKALGVSLQWLFFGEGNPHDADPEPVIAALEVPLFTSVTAGLLSDNPVDEAMGTAKAALPPGDWIAFRVDGESMDRISPPGSIIFVDRADKRLVNGGFYVIDDGTGQSTYKRFVAPMKFEPVSKNKSLEPFYPDNEPTIIGRVKLTTLSLI